MKKIILLRHSERLDEADYFEWNRQISESTTNRNIHDFSNDTPITQFGKEMAQTAAETIETIHDDFLCDGISLPVKYVYCSRLRRCVETAYPLAKKLSIPLVISKGLALTAAAVEKRFQQGQDFDFCSINELQVLCPNIEILECDDPSNPEIFVPTDSWYGALESIAVRDELCIIVAHRESIRNLSGIQQSIPYCSIAIFSYDNEKYKPTDNAFCLEQLVNCERIPIKIKQLLKQVTENSF